ncbi:hypothetical protein B0T17DRAFT_545979 [Bombardia bombarda]|uniref:Uncharacterized protein n=1 Tax=Bombardia bombarda TaxID=252184 RepID=A0AA39WCG8_9PEZI|nr:hypothetical protein B0T17DRAFT_545979 [Bombardia bombarda]
MAAGTLPGSYPLDTPLATPDVEERAPHTYPQQQQQQPNMLHNKLQKTADPRSHHPTDSGVGFNEPQRILPTTSTTNDPLGSRYSEAVGGGTYVRDNGRPHIDTFEPPVDTAQIPKIPEVEPIRSTFLEDTKDDTLASQRASLEKSRNAPISSDDGTHDARGNNNSEATPYWGNLPKASSGGVYNTVTGHGSAADDHAEHHHLPQSGGIYNGVAGHGSSDEESRRRDLSRVSEDGNGTISSTDAVIDAPLATIHEKHPDQQSNNTTVPQRHEHSNNTTFSGVPTRNVLVPEAAYRNDAMNGDSTLGTPPGNSGISRSNPTTVDSSTSRSTANRSPPRVFPLGTNSAVGDDATTSPNTHHARDAAAAGAAGVGAGAVASKLAANYGKDTDQYDFGKGDARTNQGPAVIRGQIPHHQNEHDPSQIEKKISNEESSTKGEKKHKILGIFPRRKGSRDEETKAETKAASPTREDSTSRNRLHKPVAAGAAAGTVYGLSRHKDDKHHNELAYTEPTKADTAKDYGLENKNRRDDTVATEPVRKEASHHNGERAAVGAAAGAGAYGILHHKDHDDKNAKSQPQAKHDTERVQHAPVAQGYAQDPYASSAYHRESPVQQPPQAAIPSNTPPRSHMPHESSQRSRAEPIAAAGAGVAAGLGAYQYAHKHEDNAQQSRTDPSASSDAETHGLVTASEQAREPPTTPAAPVSGHTSSVANRQATDSGNTDSYNHLASGTPSGVKIDPEHSHSHSHSPETPRNQDQHGSYNTLAALASGTAAGVATSHQMRSPSQPREYAANQSTQRDVAFPSAISDPLSIQSHSNYDNNATSHSGFIAAPIASRPARHGQQHESQNQQTRGGLTTFPVPEKHMSPEVMPSAYTAAAPRSATLPQAAQQKMSPEVMPEAYTSSTPRAGGLPEARQNNQAQSSHSQAQPAYVGSAMAAATGAWASGTQTGVDRSGNANSNRVVHKCQHCGGANDISEYFSKEGLAKLGNKY